MYEKEDNLLIQSISNHDFPYSHDIFVSSCNHQSHNLSKACYWEPLLFFIQFQLF